MYVPEVTYERVIAPNITPTCMLDYPVHTSESESESEKEKKVNQKT